MPGKQAVLSIYADPASENVDDRLFQIGVPNLPTAGSHEQFILFKEWLRVCESHKHVTKTNDTRADDRPTRVIDVGNSRIRLINGKDMVSSEYIALSHRWGDKPEHHLGRTLRGNHISRYSEINWDELPQNFQGAIKITRGLDLQYLWIDSICIIQEDPEDWSRESVRMEQVYSDAKCVLAASSSDSSIEGFLERPTTSRPFVTLRSGPSDVAYVCKNIDNFRGDVDEAILNTRGWTLQERALARRTIHFTKNQTYFECSDGIQCESLTRLTNGRSSLLGDSDFPTSVVSRYKDGRVVLVQTLYHQYSKRNFSKSQDRPIAISGLEKRLTSAFTTRGGYGVFQNFLERTLLWKRDDETRSLEPIQFPPVRNVPTWSWMAYDGVISYVHVDFDKVDWTKEYSSPFDSGSGAQGKWHWEADGTNRPPILGLSRVRELDSKRDSHELLKRIIFDTPGPEQRPQDLRCVVIGKAKPGDSTGHVILNCYVLVVKASSDENLRGAYIRVGAGELMEDEIIWDRYEAGNLH
ncbi:hypothetical protein CEP53_003897 [Fusarium sp. AF-6]|nr:hypothetical protein CEP53_003897 [Fusarium sp. AF-6]